MRSSSWAQLLDLDVQLSITTPVSMVFSLYAVRSVPLLFAALNADVGVEAITCRPGGSRRRFRQIELSFFKNHKYLAREHVGLLVSWVGEVRLAVAITRAFIASEL